MNLTRHDNHAKTDESSLSDGKLIPFSPYIGSFHMHIQKIKQEIVDLTFSPLISILSSLILYRYLIFSIIKYRSIQQ
jgi:hypothetical protein